MQAARERALASLQREEEGASAHILVTSAIAARQRVSASGPALGEAALGPFASLRGVLPAQPASAKAMVSMTAEAAIPSFRPQAI